MFPNIKAAHEKLKGTTKYQMATHNQQCADTVNDPSGMDLLEQFANTSHFGEYFDEPTSWNALDDADSNICPSCNIPMDIQGDEYVCSQCKRIASHSEGHLSRESSQCCNRYYGSSDPLREQRSNVFENLVSRRETYLKVVAARRGMTYVANCSLVDGAKELDSLAPSMSILANVARIYNEIQRKASAAGVPFVKRGDVKNEILAAIMFSECAKGEQRSKREIAEIMGLRTDGFSRGYEQLVRQSALGNATLDTDKQICDNKIRYYYKKTLGVFLEQQFDAYLQDEQLACHRESIIRTRDALSDVYVRFIRSIVSHSIKYHIGTQSQLQSKVVGAIWFIVRVMRYPITASQIDVMSSGIKKGTFLKFSRDIIRTARLRFIAKKRFPHLCEEGVIEELSI